jgi:hypothetical protein
MTLPLTWTATELADLEACRLLVLEFAARIDGGRTDTLGELMTSDATFARPTAPDVIVQGSDTIVAAFAARPKNVITQHLNLNIRITLTGPDSAAGESVVVMYRADTADALEPGKGRKAVGPMIGTWSDTFVRTPSGWRFKDRRGAVTMYSP